MCAQFDSELAAAHEWRREQTRVHGSVARVDLESMHIETQSAELEKGAGGGWNTVAPPGPKRLVRARNDPEELEGGEVGVDEDEDEQSVLTVFRNMEGAERGVDMMEEELVVGQAELSMMASGILRQDFAAHAAAAHGDVEEEDWSQHDVGPVSPKDARAIVEAERARWRTMLPRVLLDESCSLSTTSISRMSGTAIDATGREPSASAATPVAGMPMTYADMSVCNDMSVLASSHMSLLSSWSMTGGDWSTQGGSRTHVIGSTIRKDMDSITSPDGRAQALWVRQVFDGSLSNGLRLCGLPVLAQSKEELEATAKTRLVEARRAMGVMRKLARDVCKAGLQLLALASKQLEEGHGDVNGVSEALHNAGRAESLLGLSASVRLDGWYKAREAEKEAQATLQRADKLLCDMVGTEAAAMVGAGGSKRVFAMGEAALMPGTVVGAQAKLQLSRSEGHGRFTSFVGIPLEVSMCVRQLLKEQATRADDGDDLISDERLLADRRLAILGSRTRISEVHLATMRSEWQAEQRLEQAIRRYMSGNMSRNEYEEHIKAEGLASMACASVDSAIQLPLANKKHTAPAPAADATSGGSWAYICGRWHFVPPRPAAGLTWTPSHFLQLAEADFEVMRRSSLYALVAVPPYIDGFGRNKKQHWSIEDEDSQRLAEAADILACTPVHLPAAHGGALPGMRADWHSATESPWKASAMVNGADSVRAGCDAALVQYDATHDALKAIDKLPHGDHLKVADKPRAPWNSASFALGTAGSKAHWAGKEVTQGRGYERSKAMHENVRRSVVYAIGEAFHLLPEPLSPAMKQQHHLHHKQPVNATPALEAGTVGCVGCDGGVGVKMDLSSMGLDDEYCFLITHALGHHPSAPDVSVPEENSEKHRDEDQDVPEQLLPCPLEDETLRVHQLRLAHNSIGDCGALELALALSDVPWTRLTVPLRCEVDDGGVDSGALGQHGGMLREVRTLDVCGNVIGSTGATALADMLAVNHSLTHVSLADNQITGAGVEALSRALATNTHLAILDLSHNLIVGADMGPLAAVLSWNPALLRQLPDAGAHVAVNQTLRALYLKGNSLGDEGPLFIAAAVASHPTLEHVGLEDNGIGHQGAEVLGLALLLRRAAALSPLTCLSLARNSLTEDGLTRMLARMTGGDEEPRLVLQVLDVSGNAGIVSGTISLAVEIKAAGVGRVLI